MDPREPAGLERGEGKSAELSGRARTEGGAAGNTHGTVCGVNTAGALSAYRDDTPEGVNVLSVGACLYRLLFWPARFFVQRRGSGYFSTMRRRTFLT